VLKPVTAAALLWACALSAQPQLGTTNLSAGWLWPKGVYALAIHDGPGPYGTGSLDIVVLGSARLLYATAVKNGFSAFKPLTTRDGFDYWSSPQFFTSLSATRIQSRTAIAGWTPVGIAFSNFTGVEQRLVVDQFKVICSDCLLSLPGWLDQFHLAT